MSFDFEQYRPRMEDAKRRLEIARSFREPDRVPITISTAGSFYTRMFGGNIRDYYVDMDFQLDVQMKGLLWAFDELGDDRTGAGTHVDIGPLAEGVVFDLPIERPDATSPWVRHALTTPEKIEALKVPDPATHPGIQGVYRLYEQRRARVAQLGLKVGVGGGLQIHPPLSAACAVAPVDLIYRLMCDDPPLVRRLFDKLLETFCRLQDYRDQYFGTKTTSIGLADDNSAFVSDAMYRDLVMPYNAAIYARYGQGGRYLHADGPNDHHFRTYADAMKLTSMDMGGFSDIVNAKRDLSGKVFFSGGLNCRDLYGTFEAAKPVVDRAIRVGAPGGGFALAVGGETYAGVNPDTLVKVVAYAKEAGRYPIHGVFP